MSSPLSIFLIMCGIGLLYNVIVVIALRSPIRYYNQGFFRGCAFFNIAFYGAFAAFVLIRNIYIDRPGEDGLAICMLAFFFIFKFFLLDGLRGEGKLIRIDKYK